MDKFFGVVGVLTTLIVIGVILHSALGDWIMLAMGAAYAFYIFLTFTNRIK